ncbi:chromatin associated protein KTI12 [Boletus edulis BED1]|uniref:Chromatin associated protein KTI12 n=1 Tax=Boletus edulis BED1 TaxID=1328754 RepID=A0AAD4BKK8_BOLED|nr:chromatin associated protein KTI12 [Boletus edulis BED1]
MSLITISGYPCAGKSHRATQIKYSLEQRLADPAYPGPSLTVTVLSDDTLNIPRSAYDDSRSEKPARAALFSAFQRHLGNNRIVIVDALDYIKGFRYQMYCAAREAKVRVCTVYVIAPPEQCRTWNTSREDGRSYAPATLDNLIQRYEEPSSMVRWDSPLFTIPWTDADVPADDIWRAITHGLVKPPNTGTQAVARAPTDALHTLESTTTALVSAIVAAQSASSLPGGTLSLDVPTSTSTSAPSTPPVKVTLTLPPRHLTLSELGRHKRQFITMHKRAITLGSTEMGKVDWSEESVAHKFVGYLEENVGLSG